MEAKAEQQQQLEWRAREQEMEQRAQRSAEAEARSRLCTIEWCIFVRAVAVLNILLLESLHGVYRVSRKYSMPFCGALASRCPARYSRTLEVCTFAPRTQTETTRRRSTS